MEAAAIKAAELTLHVAALCDVNGYLGLEGFKAAMCDQIRNFTLSLLTDTARLDRPLILYACFYFSMKCCLNVDFKSLCLVQFCIIARSRLLRVFFLL